MKFGMHPPRKLISFAKTIQKVTYLCSDRMSVIRRKQLTRNRSKFRDILQPKHSILRSRL
jgi:hypothetical protein